jgi:hypothetical protein
MFGYQKLLLYLWDLSWQIRLLSCGMIPCSLVDTNQRFGGTYYRHFQGRKVKAAGHSFPCANVDTYRPSFYLLWTADSSSASQEMHYGTQRFNVCPQKPKTAYKLGPHLSTHISSVLTFRPTFLNWSNLSFHDQQFVCISHLSPYTLHVYSISFCLTWSF